MHEAAEFWHTVDAPVRWIFGSAIEPRFDRPLGYLEFGFVFVLALLAIVIRDEVVRHWREQLRRRQQEDWRRQMQQRNRRTPPKQRKNSEDGHVER